MNLADFIVSIRGWTGFSDPDVNTDAQITGWLRMAEERISEELRCSDMVQIDTGLITANRVKLPPDWRASTFIRVLAPSVGNGILSYKPINDYYQSSEPVGFYTVSGLNMMVGGTPDLVNGKTVEIHYFGDVPPLGVFDGDTDPGTWLSNRYPRLLTAATMSVASMGLVEDTRAVTWETEATNRIGTMNAEYLASKAAGSKLSRRVGGFG
jgi:hypothetical protein